MRGRTSKIHSSSQTRCKCYTNQMKMLSRGGEGTKLIVTGDLEQSDLGPENGLETSSTRCSVKI